MYNRGAMNRNGGTKVCDFFLQGRCKFGDSCKFEHPSAQTSASNNRFASLSGQSAPRGRTNSGKDDFPYLLNNDIIVADMKEERPQWPFSAYGPGRDAPRQLFGGYPIEQSPEEMRVLYYLAQASGNPQTAIQAEQELFQRMNQQIQKIVDDPAGAIKYVLEGDNEHPNRRDLVLSPGQASSTGSSKPFGQPSTLGPSTSTGTAFGASSFGKASTPFGGAGAASAFGQTSQPGATSAFGQPSQMGAKPAFGQSSQPGGSSAFGQPSQPGASSTFGQPSQPGASSAFGQPAQPGGSSAFGQPTQLGGGSAFGQSSQMGASSPFGQPSQAASGSAFGKPTTLGAAGAFGQPSAMGQSKSAFGQASQPANPFSNQQSSAQFGQTGQATQSSPFAVATQTQQTNTGSAFGQSPFGQPSQASQSPFGAAAQNQASPFGVAAQTGASHSPFAQNKQAASSPFGQSTQQQGQPQTQANTSAIKSPFAPTHTHPPQMAMGASGNTGTPSVNSYAQHANGRLQSWKGKPVTHKDGVPYFSKTGNINNPNSLERIWFPDGPPASSPYTTDNEELYTKTGDIVEQTYRRCSEQGMFQGNVPLLAPLTGWIRYDI